MHLSDFGYNLYDILPEIWVATGVLLMFFVVKKFIKDRKLPPGPTGLPVVGYLPFLTKLPHLKFVALAEKYGAVFSMYLGSQLVVVLSDADCIREAFAKRELLARPPNSVNEFFRIDTPFFSPNFKMWQEQRRFVVHTMKDLGLGKSRIEGHIQEEILYFLKVLEQSKGKSTNLLKPLTPSVSNNICALIFGERYDYDSPDRIVMDNNLNNIPKILAQTSTYIFFPWIRKFSFILKLLKYDDAIEVARKMFGLIEEKVRQHTETLDSKNIRDFIDGYLLEIKSRSEKDPETTFSVQTLKGSILNLFGAGSETLRTTVSWCVYIMAAYPEVQKKVQKEIDDVLGSNRFPQITDQKDMPYTQAVIQEIMRWKTTVPINVSRYSLDDIEVSGYHIPKGTIVLANFWAVHHNPKYWTDPEDFRPERFLNTDGKLMKSNYFMPFSIGKRACPGEAMAMMELFLYFVAILQKFKVSFPEGFTPTFEAELGITYNLKPFEICFTPK